MLAENLVDMPYPQKLENGTLQTNQSSHTEEVAEENEYTAITDDPGLYLSDVLCISMTLLFHFLV
jgi:E1A-binding protein p400